MTIQLNEKQADKFSAFFFDIAKGLILSSIGFAIVSRPEQKIVFTFVSIIIALWCIRSGILLLEDE